MAGKITQEEESEKVFVKVARACGADGLNERGLPAKCPQPSMFLITWVM